LLRNLEVTGSDPVLGIFFYRIEWLSGNSKFRGKKARYGFRSKKGMISLLAVIVRLTLYCTTSFS
ncbi:MAG: hypothetical protein K8T10_20995, partial [Candidatus Eremiobacteraeota bacterium]|nr:hypothetical protein [Candidatus Eremiobacteraeota bacterium]